MPAETGWGRSFPIAGHVVGVLRVRRRRSMNFTAGLILLAITLVMLVLARALHVELARFLKIWIVRQAYAMTAMVSAVLGLTIIIATWPF
jgi:hypothetical protein